jgi:tetratricopeptide (TPR) repeat protein
VADISDKLKEAETYYAMGLFEESLSVYEKILFKIDEPDRSTKDTINKKITEIKTKIESFDQDNTNAVSSEDIVFFKKALSITEDSSDTIESASVFKELGLFKEAIAEYDKLLSQDSSWKNIIPDLAICLLKGYMSSEILDRAKEIISIKEFEDKDKAEITYRLGQEIEKKGQMELAYDFYQCAYHLDPKNEDIKNNLEKVFSGFSIHPKYEYLIKQKKLTVQKFKQALSQSQKSKKSVDCILLYEFEITIEDLGKSLSLFYNCPFKYYDSKIQCPSDLIKNIEKTFLMNNMWVPLSCKKDVLEILIDDPKNLTKMDQVRTIMNTDKIKCFVGIKEHIEKLVERFFNEIHTVQAPSENRQDMEFGSMIDLRFEDDTKGLEEKIEDKNVEKLSSQIVQPADNKIKIIDENVIKKREREFIDAIKAGLDWGLIKNILKEKYRARIHNFVNYQQGNIVVHNNNVAYKFDFEIKMPLSVVIDRSGDYLKIASSA